MQTNRDLCTFQNKRGKRPANPPAFLPASSLAYSSLPSHLTEITPALCHPKEEFGGQWLQFRALNCDSGLFPFITHLLVRLVCTHILCIQCDFDKRTCKLQF